MRAQGWGRVAWGGAVFGVTVGLLSAAPWVGEAGRRYFAASPTAAYPVAAALAVLCGVLYGALLWLGSRCCLRWSGRWPLLFAPAVWTVWEMLLQRVFPEYPAVCLAATQVDFPAVVQSCSLAGCRAVSFLVAAVGVALGMSVAAPPGSRVDRVKLVLLAAIPAAAAIAVGALRLHFAPADDVGGGLRGVAVDAAISSGSLPGGEVLARYEALTRRAVERFPTDLVVWPESALPGAVLVDPVLQGRLRGLARSWQGALLAGGGRVDWGAAWERRLFNSAFLVVPDGPVLTYDKRSLVPFAESWPVPFVRRPAWMSAEEVTGGAKAGILAATGRLFGVLICFEGERPELGREIAKLGGQAIVVISNDAHLPARAIRTEVAQVQLRAVETGLPAVRAANRGVSVVVDRFGRLVQRSRGGLLPFVLAPGQPTPAVRVAPFAETLLWALAAAGCAGGLLRRRGRSLRAAAGDR